MEGALVRILAAAALIAHGVACEPSPADERPSFLLVVLDTLRADAVSAYGAAEQTTPNVDALAEQGLRYERAFAPAPWTLPSHATLLTGVEPRQHGVGIAGRIVLPEEVATLAERLAAAGYETIGLSENPLVSRPFGLTRGFAGFESELRAAALRDREGSDVTFDVVARISAWADRRDAERPFFAFVNLFDIHDPYEPRSDHLFLPAGVDIERARRVRTGAPHRGIAEVAGICDRLPSREELAIVRGLYLGEVAAADAKLGSIHRALAKAAEPRALVTIATSDHGEHLGEQRLLGHEFSLRNEVLRVPLVVHGLPGAAPAVIATPVELADVAPSILAWAGLDVPAGLPVAAAAALEAPGRRLLAVFSDRELTPPERTTIQHEEVMDQRRRGCRPEDRVFGDMLSLIDFPWKLIWYQRNAPQLFDLSWDPGERSDVSGHHPEIVARLARELDPVRDRLEVEVVEPPDPDVIDALRALGYVDSHSGTEGSVENAQAPASEEDAR